MFLHRGELEASIKRWWLMKTLQNLCFLLKHKLYCICFRGWGRISNGNPERVQLLRKVSMAPFGPYCTGHGHIRQVPVI